ncbi:MAG: putative DNA-binding domain-containing protein, partial [Methyloprofundus sp.]|nr:putative DNA-binding domain-containing protein [Methyloprofundus sp.]
MHSLREAQSAQDTPPEFLTYQHQFVDYLRNPPTDESVPATLPTRVNVYAKLLHSKINASLRTCFPILHELLGETQWHSLVQDFIKVHRCQSPLYREIPDEFVDYLMHETPHIELPEFIIDLVHYEWMELILETENAVNASPILPVNDDLLTIIPALNPVLHLLHYRYPVQSINATDAYWKNWQDRPTPYAQEPVILAGTRDADYKIHFIKLNPVTARLIELLQEGLSTGEQALL